nr:reverse transcriptase domain-containing protein [Tanacetum cinerariifolium]
MGAPPSPDYIPGPEAPPSPDYIPGPEAPPSPDYIPGPEYPDYEVIVNGYFGMPMDPLDPYVQLVMEAPPSPNYIPGPEAPPSPDYIPGSKAPPSPDYIPGPEYLEYLSPADDVLPAEEQPLPTAVSPTAESSGYITDSEPEMEPEEEDRDDEKSEEDSIEYLTSGGDDDADDDGDDLSEDDADEKDKEESSDSEEEEEEHLALIVPAPALHSSIPASEDSNETEPFEEGETTATPPPFGYHVAARILAEDRLIGRLRRERRYFRTLSTTYVKEVAHSRDYCTQIIDYCQSREKMAPKQARTTRANPDPTRTTTVTEPMTLEAINNLIAQRVAEALAEYKTQRNSVVNGDTSNTTGTRPRTVRPTRECTYKDYLNCGPLKFNGTEGVIGLTRWFGRTESVSSISNCTGENQVKFASCTLIGSALTWRMFPEDSDEIERLGNKNQGNQNQAGNGNAVARAYGLGTAGGNPNANVVTGTFLLNDHCASILFDTGADKSFVSTAFSSLININPSTLDYSYDVELADGQIIRINTVIQGCTLNLLNHPFNIDLMPIELGSFDSIVIMDWLKTYHAVIVCDEKIVRVLFEDEALIIRCDGSNNGNQLNIISCTKTRKYLLKGYHVFLTNITTKTIKYKSNEKQLEDVPIVRDFFEVFPED